MVRRVGFARFRRAGARSLPSSATMASSTTSQSLCNRGSASSTSAFRASALPTAFRHTPRPAKKPDAPSLHAHPTAVGKSSGDRPDESTTHGLWISEVSCAHSVPDKFFAPRPMARNFRFIEVRPPTAQFASRGDDARVKIARPAIPALARYRLNNAQKARGPTPSHERIHQRAALARRLRQVATAPKA